MNAAVHPARDTDAMPGWYGKVSSLGDFAQRRLSREWVATCDRWLSRVLVDSRARLGTRWLDTYLTAPVLCFAWTPGTLDEHWWFGVLMASCDNVGRYFPLVVAQSHPRPPHDGRDREHLDRWYAGVTAAALMTLRDTAGSLDAMEAALAVLPAWPAATIADGAAARADAAAARADDDSGIESMWGRLIDDRRAPFRGRTAWWASGVGVSSDTTVIDGLPDGECFGRLLASASHE